MTPTIQELGIALSALSLLPVLWKIVQWLAPESDTDGKRQTTNRDGERNAKADVRPPGGQVNPAQPWPHAWPRVPPKPHGAPRAKPKPKGRTTGAMKRSVSFAEPLASGKATLDGDEAAHIEEAYRNNETVQFDSKTWRVTGISECINPHGGREVTAEFVEVPPLGVHPPVFEQLLLNKRRLKSRIKLGSLGEAVFGVAPPEERSGGLGPPPPAPLRFDEWQMAAADGFANDPDIRPVEGTVTEGM